MNDRSNTCLREDGCQGEVCASRCAGNGRDERTLRGRVSTHRLELRGRRRWCRTRRRHRGRGI